MFDSLCGQFLVAGKRLRDSNFYKTVVLIVEHGPDGAMGLVVNRPSSISVAHALSEHFHLPETEDLVYIGGPVEPQALFILHNAPELDEREMAVVPGVYVGGSPEAFETIVRTSAEPDSDLRFRIFSGCAGWGPGQLEDELARGDWQLHPASADLIFHDDIYELWDLVLQRIHECHRLFPNMPKNPEWN
jgi:putative transcriptional regulator